MKKILVVEDEKNIRMNLMDILEMSGYSVSTAENGSDAILMMQENLPDLVISDIRMPLMDGKQLLIHMRKEMPLRNVPFLFLTSKIEPEDIREGMNHGADDYITKPFKYDVLLKAIETRLKKHESLISDTLKNHNLNLTKKQSEKIAELTVHLNKLSKSELRVLKEVAKNLNSDQIARQLYLSGKTVQNHRYNMAKKLRFNGQNSLFEFAITCENYGLLNKAE